ncbi:MAG TPA: DUF6636 domain-containing protein [Actinomycetales bacterium]|jgi:hypothetical protein|nr:DUF6636 domain-containing protein [Actinomycetales bacterium]
MPADYTDQIRHDHDEDPLAERDATRRRNTLVAIAGAAAVCLVGTLLALNGLTSGGGSASANGDGDAGNAAVAGTKTTAPVKKDSKKKEKPPADLVSFVSPSGNIGCLLSSEGARCDIDKKEWGPPRKPAECSGAWGVGVAVAGAKADLVCAKDSAIKADGKQLGYGSTEKRGDFVCESSEDGMRCENTKTGHGFTIARADYSTF